MESGTSAAFHLSPVGRGRREAPGEGDQSFPENASPLTRSADASRPLPTGERWAAAPDETWLSKRIGASGGAHIRTAGDDRGDRRYLQRLVQGRPVSALFVADGKLALVIGHSEQWTDPTPRSPFRYGGAVGPIDLPQTLAINIASALNRIVERTGLVGLASADLIVSGGAEPAFQLIEINPRPGATLDVFDRDEAPPLLGLHLAACAGRLPGPLAAPAHARAAAIVYAEHPVHIATLRRPLWTADWPSCDETLPAGAPVCTVLASAATPSAARALVTERRAALLASLRAAQKAAPTNAMVPA